MGIFVYCRYWPGTGKVFYGLDIKFFTPSIGELISQGGLTNSTNEIEHWSPKVMVVVGGMIWETSDAPDLNNLLTNYYA